MQMLEDLLVGKSGSQNETALRNTYKLYAMGSLIEGFAKPLVKKFFDDRSPEEQEISRLNLISSSLNAGIDPKVTLKKLGLEKEDDPVLPKAFSLLGPISQEKELLPQTKNAVRATAEGFSHLLNTEKGHFIELPGFIKFARKLRRL
jgi:hypothetical protein